MHTAQAVGEKHLLQFNVKESCDERILTFYAGLVPHRVHAHTRATRAEARVGNPLLQRLPDMKFSHYAEVDLPTDCVLMTYLAAATEVDGAGTENFLSLAVHVPRAGRREQIARRRLLRGSAGERHPKLDWLFAHDDGGLLHALASQTDADMLEADWLHDLIDPFETACSLLFQHPGLVNLSTDKGGVIPALILRECVARALNRRSRLVDEIEDLGAAWSKRVALIDDDGKPVTDKDGPMFTIDVHERVRRFMPEPMGLALKYSQQMQELHGQTWRVQYGKTTDERKPMRGKARERPTLRADQTRWTLKALSKMNGVSTGAVKFEAPRPGGWTLREIWSSTDSTPMNAAIVAALAEGRISVRVDSEKKQAVWVGSFAPQAVSSENSTTFVAAHKSNSAGADYCSVALTLDALHLDLQIELKVTTKTSTEALASAHLVLREPNGVERTLWSGQPSTKGSYGNLRVDVDNEWVRHLGAYVEFFDANEKVIHPQGWSSKMPLEVAILFDRHATKKYIDVLGPVDLVFGIPLGPKTTTLEIPVPESAASVNLYWGGLGTGEYDDTVCACGITCTAVLEFAFPILLLIMGASEKDTGFVNNLMKDPRVRYGLYALGTALIGSASGTYIGLAQDPAAAARTIAIKLGPALGKAGLKKFSIYLARKAGEAAAKRAIPLINLAFLALDTAVTLMQLGQTIAAVIQSPFFYSTKLTRTFDLRGRVLPDPDFNTFPDHHDTMEIEVMYDAGNRVPLEVRKLKGETLSKALSFAFDNLAAGGRIKVLVFIRAANHWESARGETGWFDARGANGTSVLDVEVTLKNALIALTGTSVYQHRQALAFERNRHVWKAGPAPTATIVSPSPDATHRLLDLRGITLAQRPAMIGYSWRAQGLNLPRDRGGARSNDPMYALQNVSLQELPESGYAVAPVGFTLPCGAAYDLGSAPDGSGANYYLDPSGGEFHAQTNPRGGYHLRRIALSLATPPRLEPGTGPSWGRFPRAVDSFVVHPQGYAAGVATDISKLFILQLPASGADDARATIASLYSGEGDRVGLLSRPTAIAVALDGRLLVLEQGNRRVQCFDISGNPVPYFTQAGSSDKSAVLPLRVTPAATTVYLDLSVEAKGYLFVLARDDDGSLPEHYRVDIYEPNGKFLVSTPRVAAARIAVDLARSLYTLNWETLIGAEGRTEPSVSKWLAPPPAPPPKAKKRRA